MSLSLTVEEDSGSDIVGEIAADIKAAHFDSRVCQNSSRCGIQLISNRKGEKKISIDHLSSDL